MEHRAAPGFVPPVPVVRAPALDGRTGLEGIASFVSECLPRRTHTRITRNGRLHFGPRRRPGAPPADGRWDALAGLLGRHAPFRVVRVPDVLPYKYTKLLYN